MYFRTRFEILDRQSDEALLSSFARLLERENKRKAEFLIFLSVIDSRRLYAKEGYSSFFTFLTEQHGFSESSALKRIQVSRLTHRYPFLFDQIASGKRTLSALSRLAPFVKDANAQLLFDETLGKSVREVEKILVRRFPESATPDRLVKSVRPLSEDKVQVTFTAGLEFEKDLLEAKALLSHRFPDGRLNDILGLALKSLVKELKKTAPKREAFVPKPAASIPRGIPFPPSRVPRPSRYIPKAVKAAIWQRDQARCTYPRSDGSVCGETHSIELDHCFPFALGGKHTEENLRLLCKTHNLLVAERFFGRKLGRFAPGEAVQAASLQSE